MYGFTLGLYQVSYKYMSLSISVGSEVGVVAVGVAANIIVFLLFTTAAHFFYKVLYMGAILIAY